MSRSFWVTGAGQGLGLALVERLLEQGHRVAVSGRDSQELDALGAQYGAQLLRLPGLLSQASQADAASQQLQAHWQSLDGMIINAGTCDYLPDQPADTDLFEMIVSSNLQATEHGLACALPLLAKGSKPQVMVVFSRYSALQLFEPNQPLSARNSPLHWVREQRQALHELGIALTIVAPPTLKAPVTQVQPLPEAWTAQATAQALVARLEQPEAELVLEALDMNSLWPLP